MWNEFKKFAFKGNVLDLAVGVIIGAAFGKIVSSLVDDIIMPIIGFATFGATFSELTYNGIRYGAFLQSVMDFFLTALAIFFFIRIINRYRKKEEAKPAAPKPDAKEALLVEIRDLLKEKKHR
ncbi:large conductance mechanosensitive channel protein MscL [Mesobacillus subterraneus]|uniref:large conductance mechanosensitive channel protein MscL n=1 Tax=Mesobacillus subterraneus TaxID=285983 RepID=UPI001CFF4373|nr:large conductance mechanosensitive channel protein MscL [Mesobacillus subterraneus]WLR54328.1 large conductance mechanosensitive channel protein MscL [Mesobacillus subterraneus]